ncbi:unnamed protein product [Larinioides sclopetarius]|uniref:LAGLIDADG homing endonuclease n=1 Tax=Larinioides sclopetarius TaxID=280406 RepID=A0AAV1YR82_9ARAC
MTNPNTAPVYPRNQSCSLFYCGDWTNDADCKAKLFGDGTWKTVHNLGGNYKSIELKERQRAVMNFLRSFNPHQKLYCLALNLRIKPLDDSRTVKSTLHVRAFDGYSTRVMRIDLQTKSFTEFRYLFPFFGETQLSFEFYVPRGAGKTILDIRRV